MTVMLKPGIIMIPLSGEENTAVFHATRDGEKTVQIRNWEILLRKIKAYGNIFPAEPRLLLELLTWGKADYVSVFDPYGRKYEGKLPGGNYAWDYYKGIPVRDMTLTKSYETAVAAMCSDIEGYVTHAIIFSAITKTKSAADVAAEVVKPVVVGEQFKNRKDVVIQVP
jgi:hypothetical protein